MQLLGSGGIIDDGDNVVIDTVANSQSANISYDDTTGEFTISQPGNYYVTWWIATDGAGIATQITFGIVVHANPAVTASSPIVTGQLSGRALITVGAVSATLMLVNLTGDDVFLSPDTPVQASIVIIEVRLRFLFWSLKQ